MNEDRLMQELRCRLVERGYQSRITSVEHLRDLQEGIEGGRARGLLNEEFYQERLTYFFFKLPEILPNAKALIVVAVPQPKIRIVFTWQKEARPVIIPPTYVAYREANQRVGDILSSILNPEGYHVAQASLPVKLLAVRSELGDYGRNNICYVPGMGSFHRLVAFFTDMPCPRESWRQAQMMESCEKCLACLHSCPTSAIVPNRFLIRAERCITFHNERAGDFPSWIDPSWHNCLVGCLRCQMVCPQNADFREWVEEAEVFSEEETTLMLERVPSDPFPPEIVRKLGKLDLLEYSDVIGRNLGTLLNRGERNQAKLNQEGA
jgi:epoxyqueuosine reductase